MDKPRVPCQRFQRDLSSNKEMVIAHCCNEHPNIVCNQVPTCYRVLLISGSDDRECCHDTSKVIPSCKWWFAVHQFWCRRECLKKCLKECCKTARLQDCKTAARLVVKRRGTSALSRLWALSEPKFGSPPANRDMDPPSDNVTEKGYTLLSTEERNCSLSRVSHRRCASLPSHASRDDVRTM